MAMMKENSTYLGEFILQSTDFCTLCRFGYAKGTILSMYPKRYGCVLFVWKRKKMRVNGVDCDSCVIFVLVLEWRG